MGKNSRCINYIRFIFFQQVDGKLKKNIFQRAGGQHRRHWGSAEGGGKDQPLPFKVAMFVMPVLGWQCNNVNITKFIHQCQDQSLPVKVMALW